MFALYRILLFSFPAKPLGCYGDGGAIFTDDEALAERINLYKIHGKGTFKYDNVRIGMNSRLDTIQVARWYTEALKDTAIKTPQIPEGYLSSWAQYAILLSEATDRDQLQEALKAQGIPTMVYYPKPMHKQTAFRDVPFVNGSCCITEILCGQILGLPIHPYISKPFVFNIKKCLTKI